MGLSLETFSASKEYDLIDLQGKKIPILRIGTRYSGLNSYFSFVSPKIWRFQPALDFGGFIFKPVYAVPELFETGFVTTDNGLKTFTTFKINDSNKKITIGLKSLLGFNFYATKKIIPFVKFELNVDNTSEIIINSKLGLLYAI